MDKEDVKDAAQIAGAVQTLLKLFIGLIVGIICFAFWFGYYYFKWQDALENGSPAIKKVIEKQEQLTEEQRKWNAGQAVTNATLQQIVREQERRITKLEDK